MFARLLIFLAVVTALLGCSSPAVAPGAVQASPPAVGSPAPAPPFPIEPPSADAPQQSDAACRARGGEMRRVGRMQSLQCVTPTADAGRACTDSDQCEGRCLLPEGDKATSPDTPVTGVCQAESVRFGCFQTVEDGRAGPALCVD